jgi:hypothetical protein
MTKKYCIYLERQQERRDEDRDWTEEDIRELWEYPDCHDPINVATFLEKRDALEAWNTIYKKRSDTSSCGANGRGKIFDFTVYRLEEQTYDDDGEDLIACNTLEFSACPYTAR